MRYLLPSLFILLVTTKTLFGACIMGVVPQQSPLKLFKVWSPIAKYLSKECNKKIIFKTEKSISLFEQKLYHGSYDFAYVNPVQYILAHKRKNYIAQVRANKKIRGILVMKKGVEFKQIKDKDRRYLFPAPTAFAATILTKRDLIQEYNVSKNELKDAHYVNSHDSVYKGISRGIGNIGGGIERTFYNINDTQTKNNLHIVHKTKSYPSHPFAFKPDMDKTLRNCIVKSLLSLPKSFLKSLNIKKIIKTEDAEYNSIRELALNPPKRGG